VVDLSAWGPVRVTGRLGGGHRNEVYEVSLGGERLVARRSVRTPASLTWELDLLELLSEHGFAVPEVVPTRAGERSRDGVVVQRWLSGREPGEDDWPSVAAELRRLHAVTEGRPPRPDFPGTTELLVTDRGGDVDLTAMPPAAVAACRDAWRALTGTPTVIHGDPCAANIRVTGAGVGFLDWDEARVDHPDLDLADLPAQVLPPERQRVAGRAVDAWEAANGWLVEPGYARTRLAALLGEPA
jgi:Ser/Thr protein kinase RdoA (MazF antagonist)